jgi:hypothetical protein
MKCTSCRSVKSNLEFLIPFLPNPRPTRALIELTEARRFRTERQVCWCSLDSRNVFAYHAGMFQMPSGRKTFVVTCKGCRRDVPSGRDEFRFSPSPSSAPSVTNCAGICPRRSFLDGLTSWPPDSSEWKPVKFTPMPICLEPTGEWC